MALTYVEYDMKYGGDLMHHCALYHLSSTSISAAAVSQMENASLVAGVAAGFRWPDETNGRWRRMSKAWNIDLWLLLMI